jgi:hypothetical protein
VHGSHADLRLPCATPRIAPGIGVLVVEAETRKQFEQMRAEILRRQADRIGSAGAALH